MSNIAQTARSLKVRLRPQKRLDDVYLRWLSFANAGMLDDGNPYLMDLAIRNLPTNNPVLEIGSFCGLSTNIITYLLNKHARTNPVFTCDKWVFEGSDDEQIGNGIPHAKYRDYVRETYIRNVQFFSPGRVPFTIEAFSDELFEQWERRIHTRDIINREAALGGNFSFVYIDGNHTYDFAKRDFLNADRNLDIHGYVLFDDSDDSNPFGLTRLMTDVRATGRYELVMKNPNYLFRKIA